MVVNIEFKNYTPRKEHKEVKLAESYQIDYDPKYDFVRKRTQTVTLPDHNLDNDIR